MLHRLFYLILFLLVSFQISCKTVREVKSIESKGISDPLSDRFIGSSVSKYESGVRHSMDTKRTTTKKIFGGNQQNSFFSGRYNKKSFNNGKSNNYSNDQFNPGDYYFAQKRETKTNQALFTKRRSSDADKKAREGIGSWFSKGKKLDKNDYRGSKKLISTSSFQSAVEAQDKNRSLGPDIINRAGTENAPQGMSIEDVKRLLGN